MVSTARPTTTERKLPSTLKPPLQVANLNRFALRPRNAMPSAGGLPGADGTAGGAAPGSGAAGADGQQPDFQGDDAFDGFGGERCWGFRGRCQRPRQPLVTLYALLAPKPLTCVSSGTTPTPACTGLAPIAGGDYDDDDDAGGDGGYDGGWGDLGDMLLAGDGEGLEMVQASGASSHAFHAACRFACIHLVWLLPCSGRVPPALQCRMARCPRHQMPPKLRCLLPAGGPQGGEGGGQLQPRSQAGAAGMGCCCACWDGLLLEAPCCPNAATNNSGNNKATSPTRLGCPYRWTCGPSRS